MNAEVLLAGSLGALGAFVLGAIGRLIQRRREERGLARLLHIEILHNSQILEGFYKNPKRALSEEVNLVEVGTWESVRIRLAQLMPAKDFGALAFYYMFLQGILFTAFTPNRYTDPAALMKEQLEVMAKQEEQAITTALAYANKKVPFG